MENLKELNLEMVKEQMDDKYCLIYVDHNDNLDNHAHVFSKCIEDKSADSLHEYFSEWYSDPGSAAAHRAGEEIKMELIRMGYKRWVVEKFFDEHEDEIRDEIYARDDSEDVEYLLRNTRKIPVRIEMLSNYDCINSHWLESSGGYGYEESYFGDMVDALWLNPKKVKQILVERGEKVYGRFPDRKYRDGKEHVSYEQFYEELVNSSCGANLLTFAATVDPMELYESDFNISKLTIPKGNQCGLYSSMYGGGSIVEMDLLHDITIDLEKTQYPKYRLAFEMSGKGYDYSIKQVYGVCNSFYGKCLQFPVTPISNRVTA